MDSETHRCSVCGRTFDTERDLQRHIEDQGIVA